MNPLTKLGTALMVVFVVSVVALAVQILWVLLRSRKFRQRSLAGGGGRGDQESAGGGAIHAPPPSKELLYFFCWNNQSRIEPDGAPGNRTEIGDRDDDYGDELAKWQRLYGPPRMLFTINEEEREDAVDSDDNKRVYLRERLAEVEDEAPPDEEAASAAKEAVALEVEEGVTPFSTPCASPPYFTPSPSPVRDDRQAAVAIVLDGES